MSPVDGDRGASAGRVVACLLVLGLGAWACGTLDPPIDIEPVDSSPGGSGAIRLLEIEAVEGRPQGLLLRITARRSLDSLPSDRRLELRRIRHDTEPETLQSVSLEPDVLERLASEEGLTVMDRSLSPGEVSYRVRLGADESSDDAASTRPLSAPLHLRWRKPPPRPTSIRTASTMPVAVEIRWHPHSEGALVFRRDVLTSDSTLRPVAVLGPDRADRFVDRDVRPGGVYAYRVALSTSSGAFTQYGRPSRMLYVSVPKVDDRPWKRVGRGEGRSKRRRTTGATAVRRR
jgi:hypothetical protein